LELHLRNLARLSPRQAPLVIVTGIVRGYLFLFRAIDGKLVPLPFLMPIPIDPRGKPATVKIHVTSGAGVDITWADGHASHYDFAYLRDQCPCATCNDEREKKHAFASAGPASSAALPMFKPKPSARAATSVGNYAIQITFTDGHATGIYSYDHLRSICTCFACAQALHG
jgi:DUF971 family protein